MRLAGLDLSMVRPIAALACGCLGLVLGNSVAEAQFIPRRLGSGGLRSVGDVGNTGVSRNAYYLGSPTQPGYGGTQASQGNYVSRAASTFGGAYGRGGGRTGSPFQSASGGMMIMPREASQFVRPSFMPLGSGGNLITPYGGGPPISPSPKNLRFFKTRMLTAALGNTGPTRNPDLGMGMSIRDSISQVCLDNAPGADVILNPSANRRSYVEIMTAKIDARHKRAIATGWEYYEEGQFAVAVRHFREAETCDRTDPEAALGIISGSLADNNNAIAQAVLTRAIGRAPGLFQLEVDLRDKHPDSQAVADRVASLRLATRQNPDNIGLASMYAFLLWFTAERTEALLVADGIYENHRGSPLAAMAARMRGEEPVKSDGTTPTLLLFDPNEGSGL